MGRARVLPREARSILTRTGGYLRGYTHSLQPYSGCQFACAYCYVREMAVQKCNPYGLPWSGWVSPKTNAAALLRRKARSGALGRARVFCSSSTDPYTPVEARQRLTRACLQVMAETPPRALVVQTRSPLVERDAVLLARIPTAVVSVSVTSDREDVRRLLEPDSPPLSVRVRTLARLRAAGVRTQAAIAPLLPCDPERLAGALDGVAERVIVDDFFRGDGAGGRRSRVALARLRAAGHADWAEPGYAAAATAVLRARLGAGRVLESQAGFNETDWPASGLPWDQFKDCSAT